MTDFRTEAHAPDVSLAAQPSRAAHRVLAVVVTVLLTTLGAYAEVSLPGGLVPVTLQSMVVILSGVMLGPTLGAAAMISYVALGAAGVPVFAGGGAGLGHLFGPTGGYLLAFPAAAAAGGLIAGRERTGARAQVRVFAGLVVGSLVVFAGGVPWLAYYVGSVERAIAVGFTPFLLGSLLKLVAAFAIAYRLRGRTLRLL